MLEARHDETAIRLNHLSGGTVFAVSQQIRLELFALANRLAGYTPSSRRSRRK